ncbi:DUF1853 family protein [Acinetobacter nematophilus]|uniref:DUF1853 family protein n=1 Tax=Acinetobacter nematophilus TaxID=2994642 RepID=A0A9X3DW00_9GAMM|nr:DUF1853 family protein [Acinetobacter nematophilus]MCX5469500.1 DUF1853 family protein [Acinetobacter nematophilus]
MTDYFEPWLKYHHPIVRQLAFCIASPNIIQTLPDELQIHHHFELHNTEFWQQQFFAYKSRLDDLDQNPAALIEFVQQLKSTRLGLRFEYLFWFWLQDEANSHYQLIQHSIQIIEGKHTKGEIDFLVLNRITHQTEHWEVALKYYLGEGDLHLARWYGLNRSDTLFRKLNHFSEKQFQFSQVLDRNIEKKWAVLKGQLYIPCFRDAAPLPFWMNPQRRLGQWGYHLKKDLYRLQRHEWICPDLKQSSTTAKWWCNGLYHDRQTQQFYMYRQAPLLFSLDINV